MEYFTACIPAVNPDPPPAFGLYLPLDNSYVITCPSAGAAASTGTPWIETALLLDPHAPHDELPFKHIDPSVAPVPNSLNGTSPPARSAFPAIELSTYRRVAACVGAVGSALNVSGPVIVSPLFCRYDPLPTVATAASTYALLTASLAAPGAGTLGDAANNFSPAIVSLPLKWTTSASLAFALTALSTYCRDTSCELVPLPGVARTAAMVVGDVAGTDQYSVFGNPSSSWKTIVYRVPAGVAPAFGAS